MTKPCEERMIAVRPPPAAAATGLHPGACGAGTAQGPTSSDLIRWMPLRLRSTRPLFPALEHPHSSPPQELSVRAWGMASAAVGLPATSGRQKPARGRRHRRLAQELGVSEA